jgi:hypothetical protein
MDDVVVVDDVVVETGAKTMRLVVPQAVMTLAQRKMIRISNKMIGCVANRNAFNKTCSDHSSIATKDFAICARRCGSNDCGNSIDEEE